MTGAAITIETTSARADAVIEIGTPPLYKTRRLPVALKAVQTKKIKTAAATTAIWLTNHPTNQDPNLTVSVSFKLTQKLNIFFKQFVEMSQTPKHYFIIVP